MIYNMHIRERDRKGESRRKRDGTNRLGQRSVGKMERMIEMNNFDMPQQEKHRCK